MSIKPIVCNGYYTECFFRAKELDTSKEYGRGKHIYFRNICSSGGIIDGHICRHALCNGCYLLTRHKHQNPMPVLRTYKVAPVYKDLILQ
jgi:hypothetical protein